MSRIKVLLKKKNFLFIHPDTVAKSNQSEVEMIIKAVGYFRNFKIFKIFYTLMYKSNSLNLDQYYEFYKYFQDYIKYHPNDFFIEGFSKALLKSDNISDETKKLYSIMIYNQIFDDDLYKKYLTKSNRKIENAVKNYYSESKPINLFVIRKSKVIRINKSNFIKFLKSG